MSVSMSRMNASHFASRRPFRSTTQTNAASTNHSRSLSSSAYIESTRCSQLPHSSREESQRKLDKHDVAYHNSRNSAALTRPLPDGPGPLPNKFKLNGSRTIRYVPANSDCSPAKLAAGNTLSSKYGQDYAKRKVSDDSGYGSSSSSKGATRSKTSTTSTSDSITSGRRAKSIANLNSELLDLSVTDRGDRGNLKRSHSYKNNFSSCSGLSNKSRTLVDLSRAPENTSMYLEKRSIRGGNEEYSTVNTTYRKLIGDSSVSSTSKRHSKVDYCSTSDTPKELKNSDQFRHSRSSSQSSGSLSTPCSSDGLVGLRNLGNTCFMNSILQCLSNTFQLTETLLRGTHIMNINSKSSMKGKLINAYAELIKSMWKQGIGDSVSPMAFKTQIQRFAPRFVGYSQQDAQEFLRFLLEGLHDDLNKARQKGSYSSNELSNSLSDSQKAERSWNLYLGRDDSLVTDLFVGQLKSTLKCCECNHKSVTFDPFWDLSLPIPRKASGSLSSSASLSERSGNYPDCCEISLVDCLRYFTREEVLDHDERPTCEKCKTKRKSTKKFSIQRFPKVLVLHLKRFSGYGFRSKLQTNVDFPLTNLNLTEFSANSKAGSSPVYQLRAVSNHSGTTYGGHYTAYCNHPVSGKWYCYNDSRVDALSNSRVKGSNAYILFYEKQDLV